MRVTSPVHRKLTEQQMDPASAAEVLTGYYQQELRKLETVLRMCARALNDKNVPFETKKEFLTNMGAIGKAIDTCGNSLFMAAKYIRRYW